MSKPVKNLITEAYRQRFAKIDSVVMIDLRGVSANENNALRHHLQEQSIRVTVLKNSLAKTAFEGTSLQPICQVIEGSCALAYGGESVVDVARSLLAQSEEIENLELRGALMEGQVYEAHEMEALSKLPSLDEARAAAVQIVLSPGARLAGSILGPGQRVAALIEAIKKKLEDGEPVQAN